MVVPNDTWVLVRLAVAAVWFKENPAVLVEVVPVPKVKPVAADVVLLAPVKEKPTKAMNKCHFHETDVSCACTIKLCEIIYLMLS